MSLLRRHLHSTNRAYSTNTLSLRGRSAIITGGSRGIGLSIAQIFARNGASCLLVGRNVDALQAAASTINASHDRDTSQAAWLEADVTDNSIWSKLYRGSDGTQDDGGWARWAEKNPHPHILVNAAGITHTSLFLRTSVAAQATVLDTNLTGTLNACRDIGKRMVKRKDLQQATGCIINVSSLLGLQGGRGSSVYAASKAALFGLTRALAAEMGPLGVRVNAIVPGYVDTEMTSGMSSSSKSELLTKIPLGRFGQAEEIAEAALFLAQNDYANNCTVNIDGGLSSCL